MEDGQKGLFRRVDVLGRVVIPREVRKLLRIKYGDILEFSLLSNGVLMKKHSALSDIVSLLLPILEILELSEKFILFDTEKILVKEGKIVDGEMISVQYQNLLFARKEQIFSTYQNEFTKFFPIIIQGDLFGGFLLSQSSKEVLETMGHNLQKIFVEFFGD